jgi:CDP-glucose 4,6-dehydratase
MESVARMRNPNANSWSDSSVLVTGATGVVGSRLVRRLIDLGANVVCFVRDADPASALWFEGDIERASVANGRLEVFEHVKAAIVEREVDTIFHLGAQAIVGVGQRDPLGTFESNIRGTYHVLEACRLWGQRVKRIVIASSDKAYGECPQLPYTEETPLAARNPYDVSKSCADLIAQSYATSYGLPIAIARCGNIFGPGDLNWSRLVPGTVRAALQGQRPVIRSDGTPVRDYLFVEDAVSAYLALGAWLSDERSLSDRQRAFNFSSNQPLSVLQMTQLILAACGRGDLQPIVQNHAPGEIEAQHLDSSRAHRELGWSTQHELRDALRTTAEWYRRYLSRHSRAESPLSMAIAPTRASA